MPKVTHFRLVRSSAAKASGYGSAAEAPRKGLYLTDLDVQPCCYFLPSPHGVSHLADDLPGYVLLDHILLRRTCQVSYVGLTRDGVDQEALMLTERWVEIIGR